jgi:hypothetical protein
VRVTFVLYLVCVLLKCIILGLCASQVAIKASMKDCNAGSTCDVCMVLGLCASQVYKELRGRDYCSEYPWKTNSRSCVLTEHFRILMIQSAITLGMSNYTLHAQRVAYRGT